MLLGGVERERARAQAQLHDETFESYTLAKDFDRIPTRSNTLTKDFEPNLESHGGEAFRKHCSDG